MTEGNELSTEFINVIEALENIETELRLKQIPSLKERAPYLEYDDLQKDDNGRRNDSGTTNNSNSNKTHAIISQDGTTASLRRYNLRSFSLSLIAPPPPTTSSLSSIPLPTFYSQITTLDLSNNEIMDIPGLSKLINLQHLNLERGWFNTLPSTIGSLHQLETLNASRNFLRPNLNSLQLSHLQSLSKLHTFDITYNQKCGTVQHYQYIKNHLPPNVQVKITLWEEVGSIPGSYVGSCASDRNPLLLRSQLEPWGTVQLRKRLVMDFNQLPTDANVVDRAGVMERLLHCYQKEGLMTIIHENDQKHNEKDSSMNNTQLVSGIASRKRVYVDGTPVDSKLIHQLLEQLRIWTKDTGLDNKNRERPSIKARNYMILRKPRSEEEIQDQLIMEQMKQRRNGNGGANGDGNCDGNNKTSNMKNTTTTSRASRRAIRKAKKMSKYQPIWNLAIEALHKVNPKFANQCTEIAVTFGFQGSPHIDKQNSGPFYGLSIGNFKDGQGGICVECSARVVAVVNTKHRLGRVDGRYPHWVDGYDEFIHEDENEEEDGERKVVERYSLIYYETGGDFKKPGPAVFSIPFEKE